MGPEFDPENDFVYADRIRRCQPGDTTLGLSPHMDSGSYERWCDQHIRLYTVLFMKDISKALIRRQLFVLKHANMHRLPSARCFERFKDGLH